MFIADSQGKLQLQHFFCHELTGFFFKTIFQQSAHVADATC